MRTRKLISLTAAFLLVLTLTAFLPKGMLSASALIENPYNKQDNQEAPYDSSYWVQPSIWDVDPISPDDYTGDPIRVWFDKVELENADAAGKEQTVTLHVEGAENKVSSFSFRICYDTRLTLVKQSGKYAAQGEAIKDFYTSQVLVENGYFVYVADASNNRMKDGDIITLKFQVPYDAMPGDLYPIGIRFWTDGTTSDKFIDQDQSLEGKQMMTYVFNKGIENGYIKVKPDDDDKTTYMALTLRKPRAGEKITTDINTWVPDAPEGLSIRWCKSDKVSDIISEDETFEADKCYYPVLCFDKTKYKMDSNTSIIVNSKPFEWSVYNSDSASEYYFIYPYYVSEYTNIGKATIDLTGENFELSKAQVATISALLNHGNIKLTPTTGKNVTLDLNKDGVADIITVDKENLIKALLEDDNPIPDSITFTLTDMDIDYVLNKSSEYHTEIEFIFRKNGVKQVKDLGVYTVNLTKGPAILDSKALLAFEYFMDEGMIKNSGENYNFDLNADNKPDITANNTTYEINALLAGNYSLPDIVSFEMPEEAVKSIYATESTPEIYTGIKFIFRTPKVKDLGKYTIDLTGEPVKADSIAGYELDYLTMTRGDIKYLGVGDNYYAFDVNNDMKADYKMHVMDSYMSAVTENNDNLPDKVSYKLTEEEMQMLTNEEVEPKLYSEIEIIFHRPEIEDLGKYTIDLTGDPVMADKYAEKDIIFLNYKGKFVYINSDTDYYYYDVNNDNKADIAQDDLSSEYNALLKGNDSLPDRVSFTISKEEFWDCYAEEIEPKTYTEIEFIFRKGSEFKLGDVNADGNIDIEDAVMVINHVNGQKALTDEETKRADIDGNKDIDIEDAVAIIAHINGVKSIS